MPPHRQEIATATATVPHRPVVAVRFGIWPDTACLLLLLLFACLVAAPIFGGGVPIATDTLSLWPPQAISNPQEVHNPDLADSALLYLPWQRFIRDSIAGSEWPLWNPNLFAGYPFQGVAQAQLYYPIAWIGWLLPLALATQISALLHLWLAGVGMYWLGRVLGVSRAGSLIGGLAFAGAGPMYMGIDLPFSSNIYVWLPWVLAAAELAWRRHSWTLTATAGLLFGVLALSGNPQWFLYSAAALGFWLGLRVLLLTWTQLRGNKAERQPARIFWSQVVRVAAILIWGPLLAAVEFLPFFEFSGLSTRLSGPGFPIGPDQLDRTVRLLARQLHMFVPQFHGNSALKIGNPLIVDNCWYLGLAPLALAIVALLLRREKRVWSLGAIAIGGFATAAQLPLFSQIPYLPGLQTILPPRAAYLFIFGAAALSGLGFDSLLSLARRKPRAAAATGALLALGGLGIAAALLDRHNLSADNPALHQLQETSMQWAGFIFMAFLVWIAATVLLRGGKSRGAALGLTSALLLLVGFDLLTYAPNYNTYVSAANLQPSTPAADTLLADRSLWRMMGVTAAGPIFVPNSHTIYQRPMQDVRGYESLHLAAYEDYWAAIEPEVRNGVYFNVLLNPQSYDSTRADLLNTKYIVTAGPLTGTLPSKLELIYTGKDALIYRNNAALPRAFLVANAETLDSAAIADRLSSLDFNPRDTVLLDQPIPAGMTDLNPGAEPPGNATITAYRNLSVDIDATMNSAGWLVLGDVNYPGWQVEVDGQPAPLYTAYGILRAVPLEAGTHQVRFAFRPTSFFVGLVISTGALLVGLLVLAAGVVRWRKQGAPTTNTRIGDELVSS